MMKLTDFTEISGTTRFMLNAMNTLSRVQNRKLFDDHFPLEESEIENLPPYLFRRAYQFDREWIQSHQMITMWKEENQSKRHILYLHGGGYVSQGSTLHWYFIDKLLRDLGGRVTFIDYPTAPDYCYRDTHNVVYEGFQLLMNKYPEDEFVLMGDSAGGGLALSFAQVLRDKAVERRPKKMVLYSPWVDLTMTHPKLEEAEAKDALLSKTILEDVAKAYSKGDDRTNPLISPIFGDLHNLGEIQVYFGTHEILEPECGELLQIAEEQELPIEGFRYAFMPHVWAIMPFEESNFAFQLMKTFLIRHE
jgi:acetyl esterase/lipase